MGVGVSVRGWCLCVCVRGWCVVMMICLPKKGTPPQHSSRHGPRVCALYVCVCVDPGSVLQGSITIDGKLTSIRVTGLTRGSVWVV